jgi:thiol-disulfide isomerase/thioredoxin
MKKNNIIFVIIGLFVIIVFGIVVISLNGKVINYKERSVDDWYNDITNNKEVLTVFGASYCSHCQEYYPVISKLASKYDINLYFFEIDTLQKQDSDAYSKLMNSFEISEFTGSVPFSFTIENNKIKNYRSGYMSRDDTISFLKEWSFIKN